MTGKYNITINQGSTFSEVYTWKDCDNTPYDLSSYSAKMEVRESASSSAILTLNSGAEITLGGALGTITILVSATTTGALTAGDYKYDLELTSGAGIVTRLIEGSCTVSPQITQQ